MLLGSSLLYQSWHHHSYYLSVCVDGICNCVISRTHWRYLLLGHLQMHLPLIILIPWWPEKRSCQSHIPTWSSFVSVSAAAGSSPNDSSSEHVDDICCWVISRCICHWLSSFRDDQRRDPASHTYQFVHHLSLCLLRWYLWLGHPRMTHLQSTSTISAAGSSPDASAIDCQYSVMTREYIPSHKSTRHHFACMCLLVTTINLIKDVL